MPFATLLADLVHKVKGAEGAVLADYDGEPVAEALSQNSPFDRYGIQLLGAQLRAPLDYFDRIHQTVNIKNPQSICIRSEERCLFIHLLNDRYFVVLAVKNGFGLVNAEYQLDKTADLLSQNM